MASDYQDNINITIPTSIEIVLDENGESHISPFTIENGGTTTFHLVSIIVNEENEWELVDKGSYIPVDTKNISFVFEGRGSNSSGRDR